MSMQLRAIWGWDTLGFERARWWKLSSYRSRGIGTGSVNSLKNRVELPVRRYDSSIAEIVWYFCMRLQYTISGSLYPATFFSLSSNTGFPSLLYYLFILNFNCFQWVFKRWCSFIPRASKLHAFGIFLSQLLTITEMDLHRLLFFSPTPFLATYQKFNL